MAQSPKKITRPWVQERKPFVGFSDNYEFYNSYAWRKVSKLNLEKNPLCVSCLQNDLNTMAKVTDHIVPISKGGDKWSEDNHQSLCHECHNAKSARERGRG